MSVVTELREAQKLYEDAGVDGSEGARMMKVAADEIELLQREVKPREFWVVNYDGTAWGTKEQADYWAEQHESFVHHVQQISEY